MQCMYYSMTAPTGSQSHECTWPPPTQHQQQILTTRFIPVCSPHSLTSNMVLCRALLPSHCFHIPTTPTFSATTTPLTPDTCRNHYRAQLMFLPHLYQMDRLSLLRYPFHKSSTPHTTYKGWVHIACPSVCMCVVW